MRPFQKSFSASNEGAAAVEFAIISSIFLLMLLGVIAFSALFTVYGGVQQLTAEAARASVVGISGSERDQIARNFIAGKVGTYAYLDARKLNVTTTSAGTPSNTFTVSIDYDLSGSAAYQFINFVPLPSPVLRRSSSIQFGGY